MATSNVQLLGSRISPYTNRVQIALKLKSIEHEFIQEDLFSGNKSELLLKANPVYKKIPVLMHGHKSICESLLIIEYIDETWSADGPSILPSDPYDRATARFWAAYIDQTWFPQFIELRKALDSADEEAKAACVVKILEGMALLEEAFVKCSKGGAFFGGDNIGYIDIVLGSKLGWIKVAQIVGGLNLLDETKAPGLSGWAQRFVLHNAAKDIVPEPQKLMELYQMRSAARASSG